MFANYHRSRSHRSTAVPRGRRRVPPVIAALAAVLLMTTYLIPAYADTGSAEEVASGTVTGQLESQSLTSTLSSEVSITRDAYTVTRPVPKPKPRMSFARLVETGVSNSNSPIKWPFPRSVPIASGFGYRLAPCAACSSFHDGLDMTPGAGTPIQAVADGVVREMGNPSGALGVYVVIDHQVNGERFSSLYAHMAYGSLALAVGQQVTVGQLVGRVGSTGTSTGAHLHLGIFVGGTAVDPYAWLTQRVT
jgi:murein DD-endopeptidase MepM/ murein hydrolase activator NlpD